MRFLASEVPLYRALCRNSYRKREVGDVCQLLMIFLPANNFLVQSCFRNSFYVNFMQSTTIGRSFPQQGDFASAEVPNPQPCPFSLQNHKPGTLNPNPKPYLWIVTSLKPTPSTRSNPEPSTPCPTLNPKPCTRKPKIEHRNPKFESLNPQPGTRGRRRGAALGRAAPGRNPVPRRKPLSRSLSLSLSLSLSPFLSLSLSLSSYIKSLNLYPAPVSPRPWHLNVQGTRKQSGA